MRMRRGTSPSFWKQYNGGQTYRLVDLRNKMSEQKSTVPSVAQSAGLGRCCVLLL